MSKEFLSDIADVIEDARQGRMIILIDDECRENEGDLIIPAQMATSEKINFMAKYGRGLICLALESDRVRVLDLPLMSQKNNSRHQTAFTVSIEAAEGITTGISAADRAHTIAVAIDDDNDKNNLVSPGHVFPLVARDGGVLVRAGHTEASVDIARMAGLNPSAVICEIMNDDGTMARMSDLIAFAQLHGLKVAKIGDLIAYRRRHDSLVKCIKTTSFNSIHGGGWTVKAYVNMAEYAEHLVLIKGEVSPDAPTLVRMHALNIFDDIVFEDSSRAGQLSRAMEIIGEEGSGVVVIIRDTRPTRLTELMGLKDERELTGESSKPLRDYGIGAQILYDLGVRDIILLSNTQHTIVGLDGYGLNIVEQKPIN